MGVGVEVRSGGMSRASFPGPLLPRPPAARSQLVPPSAARVPLPPTVQQQQQQPGVPGRDLEIPTLKGCGGRGPERCAAGRRAVL